MHGSGIVRRVDDLGRIVIPKELRRTLRLKEGDPVEISRDGESLFLKKYSPLTSMQFISKNVVDGVKQMTGKECLVADTDKIIQVSGDNDLSGNVLSQWVGSFISERREFFGVDGQIPILFIGEDVENLGQRYVLPLIQEGDCLGIIALSSRKGNEISEQDKKMLKLGANILVNSM